MSRLLNAYAYIYATYLVVYIYFLYDLLQVSSLKVLLLSTFLLLETFYVLKEDSKRISLFFFGSVLICTLLSYRSFLSLIIGIYYCLIQGIAYFVIREGKEIEFKHLWIPFILGFAVSMYLYEFRIHGFEESMLAYLIIALCALSSSNLEIYYLHRNDSKEKKWLDYSLLGIVCGVSLFNHWILQYLQSFVSFVVQIFLSICITLFSTLVEVFGYIIGVIMAKIFKQGSLPDLKIEIPENILGPLKPAETQNVDFIKIIFQVLIFIALISLIHYLYKRYKEDKRIKGNKKVLKAYYQEIEDLEREKVSVKHFFKRENLSKVRRMYKKEVKKRIRQGYTFLDCYTPKEYLKTLPDSSLNQLTKLYQEERYGGNHEKRS